MAEERLYSLTEMAESLGLAEPTARRYRDAFEEFLPSVGVGRRRKFTEPAKQMLARIAGLVHEQRMPVEVVRRILTSERTQSELSLTPAAPASGDLAAELRSLRAAVEMLTRLVVEQREAPALEQPTSFPGAGDDSLMPFSAAAPDVRDRWLEADNFDAGASERVNTALLSLRELITESVGVTLRQIGRLQEAQEETRAHLQQLSEDLFSRDEQTQLLMETTAEIAARCEQLADRPELANGARGSRRLWRG